MIYCKKKEQGENFAIYNYGHDTKNMTGEVRFMPIEDEIEMVVIKNPDDDPLGEYGLPKVAYKYMKSLLSCSFPEKMAYERG